MYYQCGERKYCVSVIEKQLRMEHVCRISGIPQFVPYIIAVLWHCISYFTVQLLDI